MENEINHNNSLNKSNSDLNDSEKEQNLEITYSPVKKSEQSNKIQAESKIEKNNLLKENKDFIKSYSNISEIHSSKTMVIIFNI
jgi:hypothetical protein